MASFVPSFVVLNTRLSSEKLALEERLRESGKRNRDLRQKNAALADENA